MKQVRSSDQVIHVVSAHRYKTACRAVAVNFLMSALIWLPSTARAISQNDILANYTAQTGKPAVPERGQIFFTTTHGREWSCASCHGSVPTKTGKHASTGKSIAPMAPAINPERFTSLNKVEKWFRRNCNDVFSRECNAGEKADVISWLLTLKN